MWGGYERKIILKTMKTDKDSSNQITVKNMVCNRCIKVIHQELTAQNFEIKSISMGSVVFNQELTEVDKKRIRSVLKKEGFELLEDKENQIINEIKTLIIESVHYKKEKLLYQNFSDFIADSIGMNYPYLSKLFSQINGKTIEQFIIEQKIEKVKELLKYDELTLSQISYELNYSSPQHLSRQFKQITGMTPSAFKKIGKRKKLDTI